MKREPTKSEHETSAAVDHEAKPRAPYTAPRLVRYGTIRQTTGAGIGARSDALLATSGL
jgi:hypothetical protein